MAIVKITELPAADSPVASTDVLPVVQNGVTKKAGIDQLGFVAVGIGANPRTIQNKLRDIVSVKDFGAVGDGVTNDMVAIQAAINSGAGEVYFPTGTYAVASATLGATGIPITNGNVKITGTNDSTIKVTGSTQCALFVVRACSNVTFDNLQFDGNTENTNGGLLGTAIVYDNIGAVSAISQFTVKNCSFKNFKGDAIIRVERDSSADFDLSNVNINNNTIVGYGSRDYAAGGIASAAVYVTANDISGGTSFLKDVFVSRNYIDATQIKQGVEIITTNATRVNMSNVIVSENIITGAGSNPASINAYGINIYGFIRRVSILGNQVFNSRNAGIYLAAPYSVLIDGNIVSGQSDSTTVGSLARGGIAITTASNFTVSNNIISGCLNGIECYTDYGAYVSAFGSFPLRESIITGNTITNCSNVGISPRPRGERISIENNSIQTPAADYGIYSVFGTQTQSYELNISNNPVVCGQTGIYLAGSTGASFVNEVKVFGNTVNSTANEGIRCAFPAGTNNVNIANNSIFGSRDSGIAGLRLVNLNEAEILGNSVYEYDIAYRLNSVAGLLGANAAYRCNTIISNSGNDLGQDTPAWGNWTKATTIQNLDVAAGGFIGWVITTGGTFGTLNSGATTGSITSGTTALVVNSNTDLTVGSRITIAGVSGVKTVTAISGTSITIDSNADATVSGAAVAFSTPVVKTYGAVTA